MDSVVNATVVVVLGFGVGLHSKAELCSILFADDRAVLYFMLVLLFKSADQHFETL